MNHERVVARGAGENAGSGGTEADAASLATRAALTSGASFWASERLRGARVVFSDGPHGVRAQEGTYDHAGVAASLPATCFPPAAGLAQSWDPDLVRRVGVALGRQARHFGVRVLLGPGLNIQRDPRGGRNFEYFSEDPHLTGVLGSAWVQGVQSRGVGACVKHFAANNAETDRMRSDSRVDARALREIYLRGFERVVREARPWSVMAAYNKINGVYASENRWLLSDVLRGEWGFDGVVVSDWGAVRDRVASVHAGLDLAMPGGDEAADRLVASAVLDGVLPESAVDAAARNVSRLIERSAAAGEDEDVDFRADHDLAREAASRSIVLLKNDGALLPLQPAGSLAVIGRFAQTPRHQGAGSSHVNPTDTDIPLDEIRAAMGEGAEVRYAPGWSAAGEDPDEIAEAVDIARSADVAVVFLGLGEDEETEGVDRVHIDLAPAQMALLRAVVAVQPRTVVVLSHGGAVRLSEVDAMVPAILDGGLLGQGGGRAVADVLFGRVNPSGRLSESVPVAIGDLPAYLTFPGESSEVIYGEGVFVGYRAYDARGMDVTYPFGHGLSYTTFEYGPLRVEHDADGFVVHVRIRNTGERAGREVAQVYVGRPDSTVRRPPRELKGFRSVHIEPGRTADVEIVIAGDDLAYWDRRVDGWIVESGEYEFSVGSSSRDIRCRTTVPVRGESPVPVLDLQSTLGEVMAHPVAGPLLAEAMSAGRPASATDASAALGGDADRMAAAIPLDRLSGFSGGALDPAGLRSLLDEANARTSRRRP